MPQTFQVLRCYKCSVFQVHQTNKSNKWECKICGEKQSVKRYYGLGTAKECRFQVQKLNGMRGELEGTKYSTDPDSDSSSKNEEIVTEPIKDIYKPVKNSKWSQYIEETGSEEGNSNTNMSLEGAEVVLEIPKKRKKLNTNSFHISPTLPTASHEDGDLCPPPVIPVALISAINTQSKTPQPGLQTKPYCPEDTFNKIKLNNKKFVPPAINKNSKWTQYTELPDLTEQTSLLPPFENLDGLCSDSMMAKPFTWCDDESNLDNILNI